MAFLEIEGIDEELVHALRERARVNGRSMSQEAIIILAAGLGFESSEVLAYVESLSEEPDAAKGLLPKAAFLEDEDDEDEVIPEEPPAATEQEVSPEEEEAAAALRSQIAKKLSHEEIAEEQETVTDEAESEEATTDDDADEAEKVAAAEEASQDEGEDDESELNPPVLDEELAPVSADEDDFEMLETDVISSERSIDEILAQLEREINQDKELLEGKRDEPIPFPLPRKPEPSVREPSSTSIPFGSDAEGLSSSASEDYFDTEEDDDDYDDGSDLPPETLDEFMLKLPADQTEEDESAKKDSETEERPPAAKRTTRAPIPKELLDDPEIPESFKKLAGTWGGDVDPEKLKEALRLAREAKRHHKE